MILNGQTVGGLTVYSEIHPPIQGIVYLSLKAKEDDIEWSLHVIISQAGI